MGTDIPASNQPHGSADQPTRDEFVTGPGIPGGAASPPPITVRGYSILREISRGGQAVILEAIQESTGRKVAIRVLREGALLTAEQRARFEREVQILAALQHPNIVGILDRGTTAEGAPYLAMEYIEGVPLDQFITEYYVRQRGRRPDPEEMLRLFMKVADAVSAAHLRGVVHRDLKPSNVRIDARGDPHILDFGLARTAVQSLTAEGGTPRPVTVTGQFLGSLPWASPEQAEGLPGKIDIRSDVYSLGIILYQMLTDGHFPYDVSGSMRDVLTNIITTEPTPPSRVLEAKDAARKVRRRRFRRRKALDETIEAIVLKALAKKAENRYQSAGDMARDVASYLSGQPTLAAGMAALARAQRARLRNVGAAAGAILAACALTAAVLWHVVPRSPPAAQPQADNLLPNTLSAEEQAAGWRLIFDGKTLTGWHPWPGRSLDDWKVEDGCLVTAGLPKVEQKVWGFLATDEEFGDFELAFQWKVSEGANSGVKYRAREEETPETAPEHQVLDNAGHPNGKEPKTSAASLWGVVGPRADLTRPLGEFNDSRVVCQGTHIEHWLNGRKVVECDTRSELWDMASRTMANKNPGFAASLRGRIVLQNHTPVAWFRSIKVRPLEAAAGVAPAAAAETSVQPGQWIDLLALVDLAQDRIAGAWERKGAALALVSSEGNDRIMVPVVCQGAYELEARFTRASVAALDPGVTRVAVTFPVGAVSLTAAFGETTSGVGYIDGKHGYQQGNPTVVPQGIPETGRPYTALVRVTPEGNRARFDISLDGKPLTSWEGLRSLLSANPYWGVPQPGWFGLGSGKNEVQFHGVRLRVLSGGATLLRPPPAGVQYLTAVTEEGPAPGPPAEATPNTLSNADKAVGWRLLFDGRTTGGWRGYKAAGVPAEWRAVDGTLAHTGPASDIITVDQYDDFELAAECRIEPTVNGGILYRVSEDANKPGETGPEIHLLNNADHAKWLTPEKAAGSCEGLFAPTRETPMPPGQWHEVRIVAKGPSVNHWLCGVKVLEYEIGGAAWNQRVAAGGRQAMPRFGKNPRGHICLHAMAGGIAFRNLKIRPMGAATTAPAPPAKPGEWMDLLPLIDPAKDAMQGAWTRQEAALTGSGKPQSRLALPVMPEGDYQLQVKFQMVSGSQVAVMLPVGATCVHLVLGGGGGTVSGLEDVASQRAGLSEASVTSASPLLKAGQTYALDITVALKGTQAEVVVDLDGVIFLRWQGRQSLLSPGTVWKMPDPKALGLGVFNST
ncbi:MAG: DUF1080 domain-containing protein, partial [Planctomycetes bacterium]|nr:DUF1080 domain-containing protein [Planctomycetota bacterium]